MTAGKFRRMSWCRRMEDNAMDRRKSVVEMRTYKLFPANYYLDCCPSVTQRNRRTFAVNKHGLVIELFQTHNFTQEFYETTCHAYNEQLETSTNATSCRFVDARLARYSRCIQQWSYVTAIARLFGQRGEQFKLDNVRVPTGCKCQILASAVAAVEEHL